MLPIVLRWIHVVAGAAWLGEVAVISFVLVPAVAKADHDRRTWFLSTVFPRLFTMASVLVVATLGAGAALSVALNGWTLDLVALRGPRWAVPIFFGGGLGLALGAFHFLAEPRLEARVADAAASPADVETTIRYLRIIPRLGFLVLVAVILSMMVAVRGL